ncbi:MAG: hypothetical protein HY000_09705 [Planctomycetes bacterium]|nr:hypothetical protein [Planctomycetota bacterium]
MATAEQARKVAEANAEKTRELADAAARKDLDNARATANKNRQAALDQAAIDEAMAQAGAESDLADAGWLVDPNKLPSGLGLPVGIDPANPGDYWKFWPGEDNYYGERTTGLIGGAPNDDANLLGVDGQAPAVSFNINNARILDEKLILPNFDDEYRRQLDVISSSINENGDVQTTYVDQATGRFRIEVTPVVSEGPGGPSSPPPAAPSQPEGPVDRHPRSEREARALELGFRASVIQQQIFTLEQEIREQQKFMTSWIYRYGPLIGGPGTARRNEQLRMRVEENQSLLAALQIELELTRLQYSQEGLDDIVFHTTRLSPDAYIAHGTGIDVATEAAYYIRFPQPGPMSEGHEFVVAQVFVGGSIAQRALATLSAAGRRSAARRAYSATLGNAASTDYRATFFKAHPELEGKVVVHHAVEQQVIKTYPGVVTEAEIHSLENLRGIAKAITPKLHLSEIRVEWNAFYRQHLLNKTIPTRQQLLDKATEIDLKFGTQFTPRVGG